MSGVPGYSSPGAVPSQYKQLSNKPHTDHHDALRTGLDLVAADVPQVLDDLTDVDVASKPTGAQILLSWNPTTSRWVAAVNPFDSTQQSSVSAAASAAASAATAATNALNVANAAQSTANAQANAISILQNQVTTLQAGGGGGTGEVLD